MRANRLLLNAKNFDKAIFLKKVFDAVKENPIPTALRRDAETENRFVSYRTYNPSLTKYDFQSLLPVDSGEVTALKSSLDVFKFKDPKYFTFSDKYILRFESSNHLKEYMHLTKWNRLDDRSVKFSPTDVVSVNTDLFKYYKNLINASVSEDCYTENLDKDNQQLNKIDWDHIKELESKSVIAWNLPIRWDRFTLARKFWWYDIHHSFRLLKDHDRKIYLTYIYFNEAKDARDFKNNLHGSIMEGNKVIIEKL